MLSARFELEKFETEGIDENLRVRLVPEPFDSIEKGSGRIVISLLVGQNPNHPSYDRRFMKTIKKDFVVEVQKHHEQEVSMALLTDETYQESAAQAINIIRSLYEERNCYVEEFRKIHLQNTRPSCTDHDWQVDVVFPSGNFKVRHCRVCSTKETVGI